MDRHQNRVVEAFRRSSGRFEISQEYSLPRKSLRIDMLYVFAEVDPVLGPWGPILAKRLVPIEHYSRSQVPETRHSRASGTRSLARGFDRTTAKLPLAPKSARRPHATTSGPCSAMSNFLLLHVQTFTRP